MLRPSNTAPDAYDMPQLLTDRQKDVYEMIRNLICGRGYGPTVREIGNHFGIKSPNGVMCHLRALEKKGLIRRDPNKSRAIELTHSADRSNHSMPMAGLVAAGPTSLAFEQSERVDLSEMFFRDDRFVLQVSGDSMINAHITDGDYVVVQKAQTALPGQMVVARTPDGEATLKYWHPEGDRIRLQPANDEMDPIYVSDAVVVGVAVGVVRMGV
jgi:repressor LexA